MANSPVPSLKVQKILRLEARARRLLTRYERALSRATRAKAQAYVLLDDASGLELSLTGTELSELRRARGEVPRVQPSPHSTPPTRSAK